MKIDGLEDLHAAITSCTKSRQHSLKMILLLSMPVGLQPMRCVVDMLVGLTFKRILARNKFRMISLQFYRLVVFGKVEPDRTRASRSSYCLLASSFWLIEATWME